MSECPHFKVFQFKLSINLLFVEKKENYTSKLRHVTNTDLEAFVMFIKIPLCTRIIFRLNILIFTHKIDAS